MTVSLDVFPVDVTIGDATDVKCRLVVSDGRVLVFSARAGEPFLARSAALVAEFTPPARPRAFILELATDAGSWTVTPSRDCGCGSPLRRWFLPDLLGMAVA